MDVVIFSSLSLSYSAIRIHHPLVLLSLSLVALKSATHIDTHTHTQFPILQQPNYISMADTNLRAAEGHLFIHICFSLNYCVHHWKHPLSLKL